MSEDDKPDDRTIFSPSPLSTPPAKGTGGRVQSPFDMTGDKPTPEPIPEPAQEAAQTPPKPARPAARTATKPTIDPSGPQPKIQTSFNPMAPRSDGDRIQIGDVLNHMFEVKRFIARGGMGEVFEGVNVQSDERVAIKVMLPSLAADPNVQAMFKKEARTLTRLSHPALVQYRVIAQEPQLGVLYIVTEYVDSKNLEDALSTLKATPAELLALTRRMADGLRVAHGLGAIHRDISPDNVLLEDGELAKARIIDFGIAKDLDPSSKTIVGDGFAGKLNFVAPEQLGDFNREVGPWTDIYSLALVILAVAQGKPVNMGGTLVDAVDKRRAGPDLSVAPEALRPLMEAMLKPNPVERLRSMDEVIAFIDSGAKAEGAPAPPPVKATPKPAVKPVAKTSTPAGPPVKIDPKLMMIGGGAGVLLLLVVGGVLLFGGKHPPKPDANITQPVVAAGDPVETARAAIAGVLPTTDCAWLDISALGGDASGITVSVKGVARDAVAVQKVISDAVAAKGLKLAALNTDDVAPLTQQNACPLLNAYASIKSKDTTSLTTPQVKWEMTIPPDGPKTPMAHPIIDFNVDAATPDLALFGLQTSGAGQAVVENRKQLLDPAYQVAAKGNGGYEMTLDQDETGWAGILVLKGKGPFPASLILPPASNRGAAWQKTFADTAAANGWQTEMIWIDTVDDVPNG